MIRALIVVAGLSLSCSAIAEPPPGEDRADHVLREYRKVWESGPLTQEKMETAAKELTAGLRMDELSGVEVGKLMSMSGLVDHMGGLAAANARLEVFLSDQAGPDGAVAAVFLLRERLKSAADDAAKIEVTRPALTHPGLEAAMAVGGLPNYFSRVNGAGPKVIKALGAEYLALERLLTPDLAPRLAPDYVAYFEMLRSALPEHTKEAEARRARMVGLARQAGPALQESMKEFVGNVVAYLDGAYAKGMLVGNAAPALDILWSSDKAIASLDDLRGKVVVLDFWATWCGPCVASLPKVAELQARYEGYPVAIVGVTSVQGMHVPAKGNAVKTEGEPEKEFALMAEYMGEKGMTWPVIFTRQSVSNGDYGIRGIPHVVIIDPAGKVRHRALHPADPMKTKADLIDALLAEFKLPAPDPVREDVPKAPASGG